MPYVDEEINYSDFDDRVNRIASVFLKMNVTEGERVSLMPPDIPDFLYRGRSVFIGHSFLIMLRPQFRVRFPSTL